MLCDDSCTPKAGHPGKKPTVKVKFDPSKYVAKNPNPESGAVTEAHNAEQRFFAYQFYDQREIAHEEI